MFKIAQSMVLAGLGLLTSAQLQAIVLFDANADPNMAQGINVTTPLSVATDFEVTRDSTLTDVRFWTLDGSGSSWDQTLVYTIWGDGGADSKGELPAQTFLTAGVIDCSIASNCRTATGKTFDIANDSRSPFTQYLYEFDLLEPFTLTSFTRYWLGLYLGNNPSGGILWQYTSNRFGALPRANVVTTPVDWSQLPFTIANDVAFELNGVPLPPTTFLLLTGLICLRRFWPSASRMYSSRAL